MGTKIATLLISIVSCIVLYIVKMHVNEKYKDKLPAPIPIELIVVVVGTGVSYAGHFAEDYGVRVIGDLPLGYQNAEFIVENWFFFVFYMNVAF
jgi:MFS superfamily sulfate permease-like transporter